MVRTFLPDERYITDRQEFENSTLMFEIAAFYRHAFPRRPTGSAVSRRCFSRDARNALVLVRAASRHRQDGSRCTGLIARSMDFAA